MSTPMLCMMIAALAACGSAELAPAPSTAGGAGGTATGDAGAGGSGDLPPVASSGKKCPAGLPDSQVCVEEGWFVLSRWTTAWQHDGPFPYDAEPSQPVYLDAFVLDQHEVTNEDYGDYLKATGASPPAAECGRKVIYPQGDGLTAVDETTGWEAGQALDLARPVVCVTRTEARAYCAFRGGRLPTIAEWLKAGRGAYPDARRFPWGDSPDINSPGGIIGYAHLMGHAVAAEGVQTQEVRLDGLGKSPWGALGLVGNASEHVETCAEQLAESYPAGHPLVRPREGAGAASCSVGVLLAGSNWLSGPGEACLGQSVLIRGAGPKPTYAGAAGGNAARDAEMCFSFPEVAKPETDGNGYRSWFVGFRCAYDVPEVR